MIFYVTYQQKDAALLPACVAAVRAQAEPTPARIAVVGPALPPDIADALRPFAVEWVDHATVHPGMPPESMVVVPRGGGDMGPELYQQLMAWALAFRPTQPQETHYAVAHATFAPTARVPLLANNLPVMHIEDRPADPREVHTAQGLIGPLQPPASFSRQFMVFDKRIVQQLFTVMQQLNPGRRLDEAVLDRLNLDDPAFAEFDTYAWFATLRYPQHVALRRPDGQIMLNQAPPPQPARPPGGGIAVSFGKKT